MLKKRERIKNNIGCIVLWENVIKEVNPSLLPTDYDSTKIVYFTQRNYIHKTLIMPLFVRKMISLDCILNKISLQNSMNRSRNNTQPHLYFLYLVFDYLQVLTPNLNYIKGRHLTIKCNWPRLYSCQDCLKHKTFCCFVVN